MSATDTLDVLVVQHQDDCPPAWVGEWLVAEGCTLDVRRPYADEELPDSLADHDALVVLGGSMGANDDQHPWIPATKALVREAASRGVATLGICLGHQLCAVALGGEVVRNPRGQQVGLVPTGWTPDAATDPLGGGLTGVPAGVHWNNDIVSVLPEGAVLLAATGASEPQVVRFAPSVWGVQLHPEADEVILATWAEEDRVVHGDQRVDELLAEVAEVNDRLERDWRGLVTGLVAFARAT